MKKQYGKKGCLAVAKHERTLGKAFSCCAPCPNSSGKINGDGTMGCCIEGKIVQITTKQAQACDGKNPLHVLHGPTKRRHIISIREERAA